MRLFSFGGYGLALAALALVVFGAIECPPLGRTERGTQQFHQTSLSYLVKTNRVLGSSISDLDMRVQEGKSVIWLYLKMNLPINKSMKRSRQELSIDMVVHKNGQITLFLCCIFIPKTGLGLPRTGISVTDAASWQQLMLPRKSS